MGRSSNNKTQPRSRSASTGVKPVKVEQETAKIPVRKAPARRQHVRLQIAAPMQFRTVPETGAIDQLQNESTATGLILNISRGGVLFSTNRPPREQAFVLMYFRLNGEELLADVVGKVKRVEFEGGQEYFVGVEFITPQQIESINSDPRTVQRLPSMSSFDEKLRKFLREKLLKPETETSPAITGNTVTGPV